MITKEMKAKSGLRLSKTALTAIILLLILGLCIGGYYLVKTIDKADPTDDTQTTSKSKLLYDSFSFTGDMDTFELTVFPKDSVSYRISKNTGEFVFRLSVLDNVTGNYELYQPDVMSDPYFSYTDLYATDSLGYAEVWRLYYLSAGIGNVYYSEAIENVPSENLKLYGLDDESATEFSVKFKETAESEERSFSVLVGDKTPGGKGYYVCMSTDKTTVYPTASDTLSYVTQPFSYYIKPRLVASGLTSSNTNGVYNDSSYEPYLTSDFKEWKNTTEYYDGTPGITVPDGFSDLVMTVKQTSEDTLYRQSDSYNASILSYGSVLRQKIKAQTVGKTLGPITGFSVTDVDKTATGAIYPLEDPNVTITYTIKKIHAVVTDTTDVLTGTVGTGAADLIITYEKDGKTNHGCLDLTKVALCADSSEIDAIRAANIGEEVNLTLTVAYSDTTAAKDHYQTRVESITGITDASGNTMATATASSIVYFVYVLQVNDETVRYNTSVNLASDTVANIDKLRTLFIGKKAGDTLTDTVIEDFDSYSELIYHYTQLYVESINRYVTREQIAGFAFENADTRDSFYGETYYKNTLPGNPYGVDAQVCENIACLLGGLKGDSSTSAGLYGTETLAVGLTPDVMEEYGLYAYTVYYELPRGISMKYAEDGETVLYYHAYTLGTYLYVSEEQPDGTRYVGSSLYDVVTKADASVFSFLNGSFNEVFARKTMVMVDIETVTKVDVSCNLDELHGDYLISYYQSETDDEPYYLITPSGNYLQDDTRLNDYIELRRQQNPALVSFALNNFYSAIGKMDYFTDENGTHSERAGNSYFREWIQTLWATDYSGELEDGEAAISGCDILLSLTFTMNTGKEYVYQFYRVSDRQVAVRLVFPDKTPTEDFYISTFAFKKICNGFVSLLNAEVVDGETGYGD